MSLFIIFAGLPVAIYFGLALLPAGRAARIGLGVMALLIGALWLCYALTIGPFFTGDANADAYMVAAAAFYTGAWALALLAQTLGRSISRRWRALRYPLIVLAMFAVAGLPALKLLGL